MTERKYLPSFADLIDRLSIVQLKIIFIPEHKEAYEKELDDILHDIGLFLNDIKITGEMVRAMMIIQLCNRFIWENEAKARLGGSDQDKFLKLTHSINGVRNTAKNVISRELKERVDLRVDCLAAELCQEFGNWNIFKRGN
jgi:hypothetical protein